jgi:hypothetical protein
MSKNQPTPPEQKVVKPEVKEQALSLNEFCIRLSTTDKRVELIGAFEHAERVSGRMSDTFANFTARYTKFLTQPA